MLIYGTMCVKDEGDIIGDSVAKALDWIDRIFVIDNGSTDETLGNLRIFGDRVTVLGTLSIQFQEGLKSIPFNYVNTSRDFPRADWWCVMDADEVYLDSPREMLSSVPRPFGRVCTNTVEFISLKDESRSAIDPNNYEFYIPLNWSETRFYRNISGLYWSNYSNNGPSGTGAVYSKRIKVFHFPLRSKEQIERRLSIRNVNRDSSGIPWHNSNFSDAASALEKYKILERRRVDKGIEFGTQATNFLNSQRDRFSQKLKASLYYCGCYR